MILIGQTIMSPNGDRNSILTQCEFSVDFSFLRSLRASQLDAIYYILYDSFKANPPQRDKPASYAL